MATWRYGSLLSRLLTISLAAAFSAAPVALIEAGEADVVAAKAERASDGSWRFDVTVRHDDTGWDHYADSFEVLAPDGTVLGTRVLLHPHETEQPFTRSLDGVAIPEGVDTVEIRAHDKVHAFGGATVTVELAE